VEQIEAKFAAAEGAVTHVDLDLYARGTGHLRRTLENPRPTEAAHLAVLAPLRLDR